MIINLRQKVEHYKRESGYITYTLCSYRMIILSDFSHQYSGMFISIKLSKLQQVYLSWSPLEITNEIGLTPGI